MARYTGAVCRLCRREGLKLFLKGERCYTDKCAIERRNYPPGRARAGRGRSSPSTPSSCARSRSCKRMYGVLEGQFRRYFEMADRAQGRHRRDAAPAARAPARQHRLPDRLRDLARRGAPARAARSLPGERPQGEHPVVPGERGRRRSACASAARRSRASRRRSSWRSAAAFPTGSRSTARRSPGRVKALPARADLTMPINEKLVVELYSK